VCGIALYSFNQVGNQIVAALELNVDVRPGVVHLNLQPDQTVVHSDQDENDQNQSNQQHPADHEDLTQ
jgi:hypothetical protein